VYIFDVDGTLTPNRPSSRHPFERRLLPGVAERCAELRRQGHTLALATNQGGARQGREGRLSYGAVHAYLRWVAAQIGAETYRFATKPPRGKPSPAMLEELMTALGFGPAETVYVGDRPSDKEAAEAAGVTFEWADEFFAREEEK
jgi:D-glycero-D-manno-heptose 1,7-bisphosphate phosphatase